MGLQEGAIPRYCRFEELEDSEEDLEDPDP